MTCERYGLFDGLRGVAALAILLVHLCDMLGVNFMGRGHLAVDFFFLLSGFVVASAYEDRLKGGWPLGGFIRRRMVRLYPLHFMGAVLGITTTLWAVSLDGRTDLARLVVSKGMFSALLIPLPFGEAGSAFQVNPPAWSLFYEVVASIAFGFWALRLTERVLALVAVIGGCILVAAAMSFGTTGFGSGTADFLAGGSRVLFSFPAGILLYRFHVARKLPAFAVPDLVIVALLGAALVMPSIGEADIWVDLALILVGFPTLCAAAAQKSPEGPLADLYSVAGRVSYPLYATHGPLLSACASLAIVLHLPVHAGLVVGACFAVAAAWVLDRWYDQPLRRALTIRLSPTLDGPKARAA